MKDEEIIAAAKAAGQKTEFGELVRSPLVRGTFSAYEIGFIEGAEWAREQMPLPEDTLIFRKGVEEGRRLEREDTLANLSYNELMGLYKNIRDEIRRREETK